MEKGDGQMNEKPGQGRLLKVLLDTNIYGVLVEKGKLGLVEQILKTGKVAVYGCKLIRDELRETPAWKSAAGKKLRNTMLQTHDVLVGKHLIQITPAITRLATEYARVYRGNVSVSQMLADFLIVSTATIKGLDVVCSEDDKTMKSGKAIQAYRQINQENGLETPNFIGFKEFEAMLK